jgi:hypothetical protein
MQVPEWLSWNSSEWLSWNSSEFALAVVPAGAPGSMTAFQDVKGSAGQLSSSIKLWCGVIVPVR